MNKKDMGTILRELREEANLTINEVTEKLKSHGCNISSKSIYSYENGDRCAGADTFLELCKIYNCNNILELFAGIEIDYSIPTDSEWEIIEKYRKLDGTGQNEVQHTLNREGERVDREKKLSDKMASLEFENKQMQRTRSYMYMHGIASAGNGFYYQDIPTDTIDAPYKEGADFIIGVNGNSMEPTFYNGDKVYVRKTSELRVGKIGIFLYNNECYIKEKGKNGLVSHNKEYGEIIPEDDVRLIGEVIGKVEDFDD